MVLNAFLLPLIGVASWFGTGANKAATSLFARSDLLDFEDSDDDNGNDKY